MQQKMEFLQESPSLTSSRCRLDHRLSANETMSFNNFKQEIEANYKRSVANLIYSFPLQLQYCASLVSSDESSLERTEEYDLTDQNKKYSELDRSLEAKRLKSAKHKTTIEQKAQTKKTHIRNQSAIIRKKYKNLIQLLDKSISPKKSKQNEPRQGKDRFHMVTFEGDRKEAEGKPRSKSKRLKTEPDQSFKNTFRKDAFELRFKQIRLTDQ